jgi:hypothetical protein
MLTAAPRRRTAVAPGNLRPQAGDVDVRCMFAKDEHGILPASGLPHRCKSGVVLTRRLGGCPATLFNRERGHSSAVWISIDRSGGSSMTGPY